MRSARARAALVGLGLCLAAGAAFAAQPRVWDFKVFLDDSPIGSHRFTLAEDGPKREMRIEARFEVKILFVTAYRYTHTAIERWRGSCLESLTARTDDDGTQLTVEARSEGQALAVVTGKGRETLAGCVSTFAYWSPRILRESRLLNAQTGEYEAVSVTDLGEASLTVRGNPTPARRYRITGPKNPIELWYSAGGEWLALESTVAGGRRLRYALN
jgi:hypothetical protein